MKIIAFLQNQWFKDPDRMKRMLETTFKGDRQKFTRTFLFFGCLTGRRLTKAFGEDLCDQIIWEEASPLIAGQSSGAFPADMNHICGILDRHKPNIVLTLGRIAREAIESLPIMDVNYATISGPHPAARHATVCKELSDMAAKVRDLISPITTLQSP